jgi:hypothetical protein
MISNSYLTEFSVFTALILNGNSLSYIQIDKSLNIKNKNVMKHCNYHKN